MERSNSFAHNLVLTERFDLTDLAGRLEVDWDRWIGELMTSVKVCCNSDVQRTDLECPVPLTMKEAFLWHLNSPGPKNTIELRNVGCVSYFLIA